MNFSADGPEPVFINNFISKSYTYMGFTTDNTISDYGLGNISILDNVIKTTTEPESNGDWEKVPGFVKTNKFCKKDLSKGAELAIEVPPTEANLISSEAYTIDGVTYHYPLLDIDLAAVLLDSKHNSHLYIDKALTTEEYDKLLRVLVEVGIVQKGILELQWEKEGATFLRLPGGTKSSTHASSKGLTLSPDGVLSGTPQSAGTHTIIKYAVDIKFIHIDSNVQSVAIPQPFSKPLSKDLSTLTPNGQIIELSDLNVITITDEAWNQVDLEQTFKGCKRVFVKHDQNKAINICYYREGI